MHSLLHFIFLLLLANIIKGDSQPVLICNENEEYQRCGSSCPPTCDDFNYPVPKEPKMCIKICKSGCFCKQGYYRNKDNQCVTAENCCPGDHEQYRECGSACVETCNFVPHGCTFNCVAGCFCESSDYLRKDNSNASPCIKHEQCSK